MNEQLTLLTSEIQIMHAESTRAIPARSANKRSKTMKSKRIYSAGNDTWWKLSQEEKELGLAGVRNIRSILQKYSPNDINSIAKAS